MPAICPPFALENCQHEIKAKADKESVHITENGWEKYVFMSEAALKRTVVQAVEDALYEQGVAEALRESRKNFAEGRFCVGIDEMLKAVEEKREFERRLGEALERSEDDFRNGGYFKSKEEFLQATSGRSDN